MFGLDFLGGAKYGDLILREHPQGWAAGFFSHEPFGSALNVIEALAKTSRAPLIRCHLAWRNDHNYRETEFDTIAKRARDIEKLARKYKKVIFEVSGACEHNLDYSKALSLANKVQKQAPSCTVVNVPMRGAFLKEYKNEVHGSEARSVERRYNFSFDGSACVDSDITSLRAEHKRADVFFFWEPRFNGRWEVNDTTPVAQRKGWPDPNLNDSVIFLSTDKGNVGKLPAGATLKTHAENTGKNDPRAEKLMLIWPTKSANAELVLPNGQVIHTLKYFGTYAGGGYRYYATDWGYLLAEKARRISGQPLVKIRINEKTYGPVNPGFRHGSFR